MAGMELFVTIFANPAAVAGVTRVPAGGSVPAVLIVIQPVPALGGRTKFPVNRAPAASSITSPRTALLSAAWRLAPAGTEMVLPVGATYRVSTSDRGSSTVTDGLGDGVVVVVSGAGAGVGAGAGGVLSVIHEVSASVPPVSTARIRQVHVVLGANHCMPLMRPLAADRVTATAMLSPAAVRP